MVLRRFTFVFLMFCSSYAQSAQQLFEVSDLSALQALNEKNILSNVASGKEKLIYFWATWCDVCKSKLTSVFKQEDLYKKYDIYLVATDQNKEKIEHFQKKFGIKPYIVLDPDRKLQKKFDIVGVPTVIKITPEQGHFTVKDFQSGGDMDQLLR